MITFSGIDLALILLYFFAIIYIGFRANRKKRKNREDYLLAGRTLTLPMFVATLVATWYGGILGIGEFSYRYGLSNWLVFGFPYYLFALVFALFIAKKVRQTGLATIPDKLHQAYGLKTALLGGILTFLLVSPAPYVLMLSVLTQLLTGWSLWLSLVVTVTLTIIYLFRGGLRADVHVNILEFLLMFLGFGIMLGFAVRRLGGYDFLQQHLPPLHLTWHGGNSPQYILVWFFIALWTLVDPGFHQRCYAARDGRTARNGILWSILFWMVFDFLTTAVGLYARASLPGLENPGFSYPLLAERILPPLVKGFFFIGLFATIMSTLSSLTFIAGTTVGNDLVGRWMARKGDRRDDRILLWSRIGLAAASLLAGALALWLPSVVRLWYVIGTTVIPGLLLPLLLSYSRIRLLTGRWAFMTMLAGWLVSSLWMCIGLWRGGHYPWGIEPMYPGLLASVVMTTFGWLQHRRTRYANLFRRSLHE